MSLTWPVTEAGIDDEFGKMSTSVSTSVILVEEPTCARHGARAAARAPATSSASRRDAIECAAHVSERAAT